jgi:hypothetical protein
MHRLSSQEVSKMIEAVYFSLPKEQVLELLNQGSPFYQQVTLNLLTLENVDIDFRVKNLSSSGHDDAANASLHFYKVFKTWKHYGRN